MITMNKENMRKAMEEVEGFEADMGGTNIE